MVKPTRKPVSDPSQSDVQAALAAMDADELRQVVGEVMLELDDCAQGRVASAIIRRGARGGSGWAPAALDGADVAEAVAFAQAADQKRRRQYGHAASLVAACVASDGSPETGRWAAALRRRYGRFPAFCAELDRRLGSA